MARELPSQIHLEGAAGAARRPNREVSRHGPPAIDAYEAALEKIRHGRMGTHTAQGPLDAIRRHCLAVPELRLPYLALMISHFMLLDLLHRPHGRGWEATAEAGFDVHRRRVHALRIAWSAILPDAEVHGDPARNQSSDAISTCAIS